MYKDTSIENFLNDLSDKDVQMGGGSIIGINLSSVCSLVIYIANLTLGKEKYKKYEEEVQKILEEAENLKNESLMIIDKDKEILGQILASYKRRKEDIESYEEISKVAVEFSFEVLQKCMQIMMLVKRISKVGNLMLSSDFEIGAYMSYSAVECSITNINVNLMNFKDENYIEKMKNKYLRTLDEAYDLKEEIIKIAKERLK